MMYKVGDVVSHKNPLYCPRCGKLNMTVYRADVVGPRCVVFNMTCPDCGQYVKHEISWGD